ncbi:MAG: hypothetical protein ABJA94_04915 [Rhodoglobus sp.]
MADREEHLDALASAENRRDTRRAVIITLVAFATVVVSSAIVALVGATT